MARERPEDAIARFRRLSADTGDVVAELGLPEAAKYRLMARLAERPLSEQTWNSISAVSALARVRKIVQDILPTALHSTMERIWAQIETTLTLEELAAAGTARRVAGSGAGAGLLGTPDRDIERTLRLASLIAWAQERADHGDQPDVRRFLEAAAERQVPRDVATTAYGRWQSEST